MSTPPWTNAWDETKPADSDLANTLGTQGRQVKLDVRQRADWQHVFGQNVNDDGGHRFVLIASAYHPANTESFKASGFNLSGAAANSCVDIAGTWNTSGVPTAIKLNILNSLSGVGALLLDLQVGGNSKFNVSATGTCTAIAFAGNGSGLTGLSTGAYTTGFGTASLVLNSGTSLGPVQATHDGFLYGWFANVNGQSAGQGASAAVTSDASNPPTTIKAEAAGGSFSNIPLNIPFCVPIKKNDFYQITSSGSGSWAITAYFTPIT